LLCISTSWYLIPMSRREASIVRIQGCLWWKLMN